MISAGDFRNGVTLEIDGNVYQIMEFQPRFDRDAFFVHSCVQHGKDFVLADRSFLAAGSFLILFESVRGHREEYLCARKVHCAAILREYCPLNGIAVNPLVVIDVTHIIDLSAFHSRVPKFFRQAVSSRGRGLQAAVPHKHRRMSVPPNSHSLCRSLTIHRPWRKGMLPG